MLVTVSACKKFHHFIYGRDNVTIETDHLQLIRIFDKPLHSIPLRLQKMKMRIQHYSFNIVHKPGTEIPVADAISRFQSAKIPDAEEFEVNAIEVKRVSNFSESTNRELLEDIKKDKALQKPSAEIKNIPYAKAQVHNIVKPCWNCINKISEIDGILFKGERVIMQQYILKVIHQSQLGIVKCKQLARDLVF